MKFSTVYKKAGEKLFWKTFPQHVYKQALDFLRDYFLIIRDVHSRRQSTSTIYINSFINSVVLLCGFDTLVAATYLYYLKKNLI